MIDFTTAVATLERTLTSATRARELRQDFNSAANEPGWVLYEREQMHAAVNKLRAANGLPAAGAAELAAAEGTSEGHSDYVRKFALHCASLVVDVAPGGPRR